MNGLPVGHTRRYILADHTRSVICNQPSSIYWHISIRSKPCLQRINYSTVIFIKCAPNAAAIARKAPIKRNQNETCWDWRTSRPHQPCGHCKSHYFQRAF